VDQLVAVPVIGRGHFRVQPADLLEAGLDAGRVPGAEVDQEIEIAVRVIAFGRHRSSSFRWSWSLWRGRRSHLADTEDHELGRFGDGHADDADQPAVVQVRL